MLWESFVHIRLLNRVEIMLERIVGAPEHVAIIMDGNGRWAKKRHLPRKAGHAEGARIVEDICRDADALGIRYLTVYAFSTENWKRSEDEVTALMELLQNYLKGCMKKAKDNNMRVRVIGDISALSESLQKQIIELEEYSKSFTGLTFTVAINYGGRDDITRAVRKLGEKVRKGELDPADISEKTIAGELDTSDMPDPDLLIRTGGEGRISNFLMWQCSYTEFYFTDVLWPDFRGEDLKKACLYFTTRDRRYGGRNERDQQ